MSGAGKARAWWDEQPNNIKLGHLYEWAHSLQQEVNVLTEQVRTLESRLAAIEAKGE